MKKILLSLAAVAMLAACSKEETLVQQAPEAIGFDNAFVENSTRSVNDPSLTASTLNDFAVFGYVEGATLFDGVKVSKGITNDDLESEWKYAGTQYWIAGANYDFYAVAPFTGNWAIKTGTTPAAAGATISFTNENGTQDLLYSGIVAQEGKASGNPAVAFTFKHILSKVKFSFENSYNASAASICVRDIKITNAYETGEAALAASAASWSEQDGAINVAFGNATTAAEYATDATQANFANYDYKFGTTVESYYERLLIPGKKEWTISFVVDLLVSGEVIKSYNHTAKSTIDLKPGMSYDINAEITAANIDPNHAQEPIEFTATMTDWSDANEVDATVDTIQQGTQN